jgi:hypothetical protein
MMETVVNAVQLYRLQDSQRAQRLAELTDNDNPTGLESELAVLRLLQEEALNNHESRAAVEIAKAIGQIAHAIEVAKIRRGELLAKSVVINLAHQLAQILAVDVANRFTGWEEVVDGVKQKMLTLVCETENPDVT